MTPTRSLAMALMTLWWPAVAFAQDAAEAEADPAREEARRLLHDARAHADEGRHAMAAERYLELHAFMREHGMERAPVALWTAGQSLAQLPGREEDAIRTLRQFLDESTVLTDDAEIRDWRSEAVSLIDELEARTMTVAGADEPDEPSGDVEIEPPSAAVSPVGPVVMGVGSVGLVAGIIIGAFSLGQASSFRNACEDLSMCPTDLRPQYDEMRAFSAAADVLYVASALTLALGLVLTLTITEGNDQTTASAACGADGCHAALRGRF